MYREQPSQGVRKLESNFCFPHWSDPITSADEEASEMNSSARWDLFWAMERGEAVPWIPSTSSVAEPALHRLCSIPGGVTEPRCQVGTLSIKLRHWDCGCKRQRDERGNSTPAQRERLLGLFLTLSLILALKKSNFNLLLPLLITLVSRLGWKLTANICPQHFRLMLLSTISMLINNWLFRALNWRRTWKKSSQSLPVTVSVLLLYPTTQKRENPADPDRSFSEQFL